MTTLEIMKSVKAASRQLLGLSTEQKNNCLELVADALIVDTDLILKANEIDVEKAKGSVSSVMLDRLLLDQKRITAMADGIRAVAKLPDPVGKVLNSYTRDDGLLINKVSVPLGVIAIIYESRPNVTSDAAALAIKSGNACILRCGKEAHNSASAIVSALQKGLNKAGLPTESVMLIEDTSRESANELMKATDYVDLLIPRGGKGLISACVENATVPCIQTGTGICHIYVDASADLDKALDIIYNAKLSRPSVCNACEVCLIDKKIVAEFLPKLEEKLSTHSPSPVLKMDSECLKHSKLGVKAEDNDFDTEFLDYILAIGAVEGVDNAIEHISAHSTGHSEAIIATDSEAINKFCNGIDSAAVYVNASTRFTDGGEFGLGCEMGISTQKLHARGPMGLAELTTYKYIIKGDGHIR